MTSLLAPSLSGIVLGGSLIIAIGAQNAFVLRQGLIRSHVFVVCLIGALSDALLIAAGVGGLGGIVARSQWLIDAVTLAGAVFLFGYALLAFRRAIHPHGLRAAGDDGVTLWEAALTCLALTFLNPHVYLDTVLLIGGLSGQFEGAARVAYGVGATTASFLWFFGLGYGARLLAPVFARPAAWRALDILIGIVMAVLAAGLLSRFLEG
jgi:L-lysine exporter family protein LysE/ArgO